MRLSEDSGTGDALAHFAAGLADGLDPQPAAGTADGTAVTSASSWWSGLTCQSCGHTFRRGDRVRPTPGGAVPVHLDPALRCSPPEGTSDHDAPVEDPALEEFAAGLAESWPPTDGVGVTRLARDDWHVARTGHRGHPVVCLYCAHTFRVGEYVVICPCRSSGGAGLVGEGCGAAIHRDPAAGLPCWENWRPEGTITVCPVRMTMVGDHAL